MLALIHANKNVATICLLIFVTCIFTLAMYSLVCILSVVQLFAPLACKQRITLSKLSFKKFGSLVFQC